MSISIAESVPIALSGVICVYIGCAVIGCCADLILMGRRIRRAAGTRTTPTLPSRASVRRPASLEDGPIDYDPIRPLRTQAPHPPPVKFMRPPPPAPNPTHYVQRDSLEASLCASIRPIDSLPQSTDEPISQPDSTTDVNVCAICFGKVANVVTVPCLHAVMCDICTGYIRSNFTPSPSNPFAPCPICRMGMRSYWLVVGEWTPGPTAGSQVAQTRKLQRYRYHSRMFVDTQTVHIQ